MNKLIKGLAATIAAGGVVLGGSALSSTASPVAQSQQAPVKFVKRSWDCFGHVGCLASAQLPSTWRHVKVDDFQNRFVDKQGQLAWFDTAYGAEVTTAQALKRKQKALKGVSGLRVISTATTTMKSATGQGPLTVSTIVYTYKKGKTTRWVATRYIGNWGYPDAAIELTVAGSPKNSKFLGTVLLKGTTTLTQGSN
ncbi:hypothetical protein HPO96_07145 [Kribbella sandramycini]|uniref:Uncharacterized protein n=1 Tax=Kribbella sandramycini TaxID=60450 RepID=A0A7Y4KWS4_9ACTN|nr:hypothetical protein [Kribbella sandramycini]MBB6567372.1 hypothetical protein [Kribbella sandramycini]NOL40015.1 hypothetical protein [Kribbella sandramycini]